MIQSASRISTPLSRWSKLIEGYLDSGQPGEALVAIRVVLKHLPRHLCTYQRLLRALWMQKRWGEAGEWAARLLRADPANTLAWQTLAIVAEEARERAQACAMWQRAFDVDPYNPEIRMGLSRTTISRAANRTTTNLHAVSRTLNPAPHLSSDPLELGEAALATLAIKSHQWRRAAKLYTKLAQQNPERTDFRLGRAAAYWQDGAPRQARTLASQLVQDDRHLVMGWAVLNATGDRNDVALARNPLEQMDPEGQYMREWLQIELPHTPASLMVTETDDQLLERIS